ncbi:hypothetical protein [Oleomonas cavernae]|uniref:hypothetical protein n=1 Tax=Oleomonas cavernae TaxID=2320859 RepID=UPI0013142635|nr:hypothetical protein [Oleomonas cavernae]
MPKKKADLSQAEQSERFRKAIDDMAAAGDLSPNDGNEHFERVLRKLATPKKRRMDAK